MVFFLNVRVTLTSLTVAGSSGAAAMHNGRLCLVDVRLYSA